VGGEVVEFLKKGKPGQPDAKVAKVAQKSQKEKLIRIGISFATFA
jgi:hypothetical protein